MPGCSPSRTDGKGSWRKKAKGSLQTVSRVRAGIWVHSGSVCLQRGGTQTDLCCQGTSKRKDSSRQGEGSPSTHLAGCSRQRRASQGTAGGRFRQFPEQASEISQRNVRVIPPTHCNSIAVRKPSFLMRKIHPCLTCQEIGAKKQWGKRCKSKKVRNPN